MDIAKAEVMPPLNALEALGAHAQRKLTAVIREAPRLQWEQALGATGNPCDQARGRSVAGWVHDISVAQCHAVMPSFQVHE